MKKGSSFKLDPPKRTTTTRELQGKESNLPKAVNSNVEFSTAFTMEQDEWLTHACFPT